MVRERPSRPQLLRPGLRVHLVGVGGSGMSAIARVLLGRGYGVSGSDAARNELTEALAAEGATIYQGHAADHIRAAELVVYSSAIPADNPELVAARAAGIPTLKRADLLGELMEGSIGIAVAGTHGKTTTTAMIAHILMEADLDPTAILGGTLPGLGAAGANGRVGEGPYFVVEADEYDHMFLGLRPEVAVITNIEHDHPDIFPTPRAYLDAFRAFTGRLPDSGHLIACTDDAGALALLSNGEWPGVELTTYGLNDLPATARLGEHLHYRASDVQPNPLGGSDFVVSQGGQTIGLARLRVPGLHNVRNALAAVVVGLDLQVEFPQICRALASFGGVQRRFQVIGEASGVTIVDDYAHHPTEIRTTLAAARQRYPGRRLWAVWQPHTFSRTRLLGRQFADSFADADRVIVLDVYRSRETDDPGVSATGIVALMNHPNAVHIAEKAAAASYVLERVHPDDVIVTLSAGDGNEVGRLVMEGLQTRQGERG
jgi:UDP-N-acetylmuramate--alanine ligase